MSVTTKIRNFFQSSPAFVAIITALVVVGSSTLSGCLTRDPAEVAKIEEDAKKIQDQVDNPTIAVVGVFDGCEVKYVDRYYPRQSFYLARCGNTATQTTNTQVKTGKHSSYTDSHTTITQQLAEIDKKHEELAEQEKAIKIREAALSKLTDEERTALGLQNATAAK